MLICQSSADKHVAHGWCVCINLEIPWYTTDGAPTRISAQDVAIEHVEPRFLAVGVNASAFSFFFIVGHGPLRTFKDIEPSVFGSR